MSPPLQNVPNLHLVSLPPQKGSWHRFRCLTPLLKISDTSAGVFAQFFWHMTPNWVSFLTRRKKDTREIHDFWTKFKVLKNHGMEIADSEAILFSKSSK